MSKPEGKQRKRGNNEGTITQRRDGRYESRITLDGGKRKCFYGKTRAEVAEKLTKALRDLQQGITPAPERETVGTFLARWLADVARPSLRPLTYKSYALIVNHHLIPVLGKVRLARLAPADVQRYMNAKRDAGLSARTVAYHRAVLRKALNDALRWGSVARNAAALAVPPKQVRPRLRFLSPEDARRFLDVCRGHRLEALFTVALSMGLRQGEALGLRWEDIDLEAGTLTVSHALQRVDGKLQLMEPKTQQSHRTLPLPPVALAALREHRRRQLAERIASAYWEDHGFVFPSTIGTPLEPRNLVDQFHTLRAAAGLDWLRFHDLRHGCASLLMAQGVNPRVVMEVLGHSQISLTLGTYSHVTSELAKDAALKIDALLGNG